VLGPRQHQRAGAGQRSDRNEAVDAVRMTVVPCELDDLERRERHDRNADDDPTVRRLGLGNASSNAPAATVTAPWAASGNPAIRRATSPGR
jgi:hypothetical protein